MAKGQEEKNPTRTQQETHKPDTERTESSKSESGKPDTNRTETSRQDEHGKQMVPVRQSASQRRGSLAPTRGWEPLARQWDEFDTFFDRLFDQFSRQWLGFPVERRREREDRGWGLAMKEEDNHLIVRAEAPGFESNDFDVQLRGNQLILRASHKGQEEEKSEDGHTWWQQEFYRSVPLPEGLDREKVKAAYRNGVLTVILQKGEESKGKRITVE